ncbi:unnamed protein product [Clavelina lepadiformis]|uniref:Mucolipin-3 n=1 Tax=Clavelina lepadiformis TaxID=159417 RepID=A0ABP0G666_CLALP
MDGNDNRHFVPKISFSNFSTRITQFSEQSKTSCSNWFTWICNMSCCECLDNHTAVQSTPNALNRSTSSTSMNRMEQKIRKELRYFFMNPCQKYKTRKRKPYKLAVQIVKIALVTLQLIIFGGNNQDLVGFMDDNVRVFERILLQNSSDLFSKQSVYCQINNIQKQFAFLKNTSVGTFGYSMPGLNIEDSKAVSDQLTQCNQYGNPSVICIDEYTHFDADFDGQSFHFDFREKGRFCYVLQPWNITMNLVEDNSSIYLCNGSSLTLPFERFIRLQMYLGLRTVRMNPHGYHQADCYNVTITVTFNNKEHSGIVSQNLDTKFLLSHCPSKEKRKDTGLQSRIALLLFMDCVIVAICILSILLCSRSLLRGQRLRRTFEKFYKKRFDKKLNWWNKWVFVNGWYFLIIVSDILTITGSVIKIVIQMEWKGVINYDACSLCLGVGCLFVWVGVLRYAGFFHQYNILVLTLKKALPHVLRFMVCASLLYLGFLFCGWVVLGPYHQKFRTTVVTSEALFSLINGDDMYMTFEEMSRKSKVAWVFSQV